MKILMNDDFVTKIEKYFKENIFQYHLKAFLNFCGKNILTFISEFADQNILTLEKSYCMFNFRAKFSWLDSIFCQFLRSWKNRLVGCDNLLLKMANKKRYFYLW